MMDFCEICDNMMYYRLDDENNLITYCKNCKNEIKKKKSDGSVLVIHDDAVSDEIRYLQNNSQNIIYDPTLPHVNNIICPNVNCPSNEKKGRERDVIYRKYNYNDMKYAYHCVNCNTNWKSAKKN